MKHVLATLLTLLFAILLAACSGQPTTPQSATSTALQETPVSSAPAETAAPETYAPMDIFGDKFNPFGMDSPCTVFEASFSKGSAQLEGRNPFTLRMTSSAVYACIAYLADTSGLGLDEGGKSALVETYRNNGEFLEFTGADGRIVTVRQANPDDDRYAYVESDGNHGFTGGGCVIELTYDVPDSELEKYTALVRDTYSLDALAPIAEYFDTSTDFAECGINVNVYKDEARTYAVYDLPDVNAVMQDMQAGGDAPWWEWNGMTQTALLYDNVDSKLTFNTAGGAITVEQQYAGLSVQPAAEGSLAALGFGFDDAGTCGVYEAREPHYKSVAIARPEWGAFTEDWNIEFMDTDINGYSLRITYYADNGRYHISVDKNGESCAYDTYPEKDEKGWESPDLDTVHKMFNDAFGTKEKELYDAPLECFEQFAQERFGMNVDELYALPKR